METLSIFVQVVISKLVSLSRCLEHDLKNDFRLPLFFVLIDAVSQANSCAFWFLHHECFQSFYYSFRKKISKARLVESDQYWFAWSLEFSLVQIVATSEDFMLLVHWSDMCVQVARTLWRMIYIYSATVKDMLATRRWLASLLNVRDAPVCFILFVPSVYPVVNKKTGCYCVPSSYLSLLSTEMSCSNRPKGVLSVLRFMFFLSLALSVQRALLHSLTNVVQTCPSGWWTIRPEFRPIDKEPPVYKSLFFMMTQPN